MQELKQRYEFNREGHAENIDYTYMHHLNTQYLENIIKGLTQLKEEGKLKEQEFSLLINRTCSFYVENEFNLRVNKILSKNLI